MTDSMSPQDACLMVARSIFAEIGPWGDKCALIGGLIPSLLIKDLPSDLDEHIGTTDVDLAVRVATSGDDQEMYRTLKRNLTDAGLTQNKDRSFEWNGVVGDKKIVVELFSPVSDVSEAGRIQRKPIENGGSDLKALGIFGLEHLDKDVIEIENEGPLLGDKGIKKVPIRMSGPAMLIALKAWALKERTKPKDGYDVVWMLKASGVESLVQRYRSSGLLDTEFGTMALDSLLENFKTPDHTGPKGWVLESKFEGENATLEARNAVGVVNEFVRALRP